MVGFSRLYDSIFATTSGVATFGLDPPIIPGALPDPVVGCVPGGGNCAILAEGGRMEGGDGPTGDPDGGGTAVAEAASLVAAKYLCCNSYS